MIFTDQERTLIRAFVENKPMADAVRRALMGGDLQDELANSISRELDDAEYGRKVKVWLDTRTLAESRFNDLKRIASGNPQPLTGNEAR